MISDTYLKETAVKCPNEDCGYIGYLEEFEDGFDEKDDDITGDFDVPCVCPRCDQKFTGHCHPYFPYWVIKEIKE